MARQPQQQRVKDNEAASGDDGRGAATPSLRVVVAALAGMAAAWVAAGSTGLLAHPLRHALTWLALVVLLVAGWPGQRKWRALLELVVAAVAAAALSVPASEVSNVLAVTLLLAMLARAGRGVDQRLLVVTSLATAVLGVYRLACTATATVWSITDLTGRGLGRLAEAVSHRPLWIGATFGGLDFLVLMAALVFGWLVCTRRPRFARAVYAAVAVFAGHLVYLTVLAYSTELAAALPEPPPPAPLERDLYVPPDWHWSDGVAALLPWNVPLLAGVIQLAVAAMMFRWGAWLPPEDRQTEKPAGRPSDAQTAASWGPVALCVAAALLILLSPGTANLAGKKIVAFEEGYLDWKKPVHGSYGKLSAGMCGMLPTFVASLGGTFVRSPDLAPEDLAEADVLVLIHPVKPWPKDRLARVWDFVRGGGSLLVVAEPRVNEEGFVSAFEDVLGGETSMEVRFDTAIPQADFWQHSQQVITHPATTGIGDQRNRFGMSTGSSIRAVWPARPLLVGRWGWSDPGSDAVLTEVYRYDPGEKLGDLVLAAEQPVGKGTVVVLGDTWSLTNEGNVGSYVFTGRLLGYLAGRPSSPQAAWRQALGLAACLVLAGLLIWRPDPTQLAAVALVLALATVVSAAIGRYKSQVLPNGRKIAPAARVACIDASHVEAYNDLEWVYDGVAGLKLTLMRSGYLPLMLPELTGRRLKGAELLISIAPARRFSRAEREVVRDFVEEGGVFICTVGAEEAEAVNPLLGDFGFRVPRSPTRADEEADEPTPMGHFRSPYLDTGDYKTHVMFYAGWPIECLDGDAEIRVRGFNELPVMAIRRRGRGKVVLVGDTAFAMNKNLEYMGGEPFGGDYENAYFWRWLIAYLTDRPEWIPPEAKVQFDAEPEPEEAAEGEPSEAEQTEDASLPKSLPPERQQAPAADVAPQQPGMASGGRIVPYEPEKPPKQQIMPNELRETPGKEVVPYEPQEASGKEVTP